MTAASAADPKTSSSSAVTTHRGEVARRTSARRASLGARTAAIGRASRLHVRSRGAPHRSLPLLRVASVRVTEFVLSAQLVHGRPGELDDLLVGQVAEIRAHLLALLAQAQEVLLDHGFVGGPLCAGDGFPDEPLLERQIPERRSRIRRREEEHLGLEVDLLAELDRLSHGVRGLARRTDHERAVGVAQDALGLADRDLHLLESLAALVDGYEDI